MISLLHSTDVRKREMNDNVIAMRKRGKGLLTCCPVSCYTRPITSRSATYFHHLPETYDQAVFCLYQQHEAGIESPAKASVCDLVILVPAAARATADKVG
jgi:hypothetical protein